MGFEPQTFRPTVRRANHCATGSCSIFAVQMHIKVHTAQLSGQRGEVSPTVCLFAFSQRLCVAFFFFHQVWWALTGTVSPGVTRVMGCGSLCAEWNVLKFWRNWILSAFLFKFCYLSFIYFLLKFNVVCCLILSCFGLIYFTMFLLHFCLCFPLILRGCFFLGGGGPGEGCFVHVCFWFHQGFCMILS